MAGRGQVFKRKDRWLARVNLGRNAEGKRETTARTFRVKADAARWLAATLKESNDGEFVKPSDKLLDVYLNEWADTWPKVRPTTLAQYKQMVALYVTPTVGSVRLSALTTTHLQKLYNGLTERGLSPRTVRYVHAVLRQALSRAVKEKLLARNPALDTEPPRQTRKEMDVLDAEQAGKLLAAAEGQRFGALFVLLLTTGMRPSEALALKWSGVKGPVVAVQRSLTRPRKGSGWELTKPKNDASDRRVTLPALAVAALQRLKSAQAAERLKAGASWQDNGLVFTTAQGTPLELRNVRRHFKQLCEAAKVPTVRLYTCRHTVITLLLAAGENVKAVASSVGHANPNMTLNVYAHALPDSGGKLAATMDRLLVIG
jgi:integrase